MKRLRNILRFIDSHPLASKHKIRAYRKLFAWQISQSFYPHPTEISFINGTKIIAKKGMKGATGNIYTGLHDFEDMGFLLHLLRPSDLFFDIGSNVGTYSILAAGAAGSRVVAVEPIIETFNWLRKNIEINLLGSKILAIETALSNKKELLKFTRSFDVVNHVMTTGEFDQVADFQSVQVETFDDLVLTYGTPVLAKIDVEGFEYKVLQGMGKTLSSNKLKAIIIELNGSGIRYGFNDSEVHNKLISANFFPVKYDPFTRQIERIDIYGNLNTIYIRDEEFISRRLIEANKLRVFSEVF